MYRLMWALPTVTYYVNDLESIKPFQTMYAALIVFLFVLFFTVAFSLQNSDTIRINFFTWTFQGSLVVVLLTALAFGVILSVLASLPSHLKKRRLIAQQQKTISKLEQSLAELQPPQIEPPST